MYPGASYLSVINFLNRAILSLSSVQQNIEFMHSITWFSSVGLEGKQINLKIWKIFSKAEKSTWCDCAANVVARRNDWDAFRMKSGTQLNSDWGRMTIFCISMLNIGIKLIVCPLLCVAPLYLSDAYWVSQTLLSLGPWGKPHLEFPTHLILI